MNEHIDRYVDRLREFWIDNPTSEKIIDTRNSIRDNVSKAVGDRIIEGYGFWTDNPENILDTRKYIIERYGSPLKSVGYNVNLAELHVSALRDDYDELYKKDQKAGLSSDNVRKYGILKNIFSDIKTFPSAKSDSELNEMLYSQISLHFNGKAPTVKLTQRIADMMNLNENANVNTKEQVMTAMGIAPSEIKAFADRKYGDVKTPEELEKEEKEKLNFTGGDSGTGTGTKPISGVPDVRESLNLIVAESVGTLITDEYKGTAMKLKQIVGHSLEKKLFSAINREFMLVHASESGFNAEAFKEASGKVDSYSLIRQQLDNATVMMESGDFNTRRRGMNTIRNLSLDIATLNKETSLVQNLGQIAQSLEYIETMDSRVAEFSQANAGVRSLIESMLKTYSNKTKLTKKEMSSMNIKLADILATASVK